MGSLIPLLRHSSTGKVKRSDTSAAVTTSLPSDGDVALLPNLRSFLGLSPDTLVFSSPRMVFPGAPGVGQKTAGNTDDTILFESRYGRRGANLQQFIQMVDLMYSDRTPPAGPEAGRLLPVELPQAGSPTLLMALADLPPALAGARRSLRAAERNVAFMDGLLSHYQKTGGVQPVRGASDSPDPSPAVLPALFAPIIGPHPAAARHGANYVASVVARQGIANGEGDVAVGAPESSGFSPSSVLGGVVLVGFDLTKPQQRRLVREVLRTVPGHLPRAILVGSSAGAGTPEEALAAVRLGADLVLDAGAAAVRDASDGRAWSLSHGALAEAFLGAEEIDESELDHLRQERQLFTDNEAAIRRAAEEADRERAEATALAEAEGRATPGPAGPPRARHDAPPTQPDDLDRRLARVADMLAGSQRQVNLWDREHAMAKGPFVKGCPCFACARHTRSYTHHLLNTQELLGPLLLSIHNSHQALGLFREVRQVLARLAGPSSKRLRTGTDADDASPKRPRVE
ncbi:hypothetical protein, variant [Fonticula alba]|nr:hypothetical protein, variant [Fonticula alba]KCV71484.1 hypothetical protein, variant [Fonticula alba]|eukprot:XP_009494606.1 hypothetical protein, variant [Fonticula alba]